MSKVHSELTFTMNVGNYQTVRITSGYEDTVREGESEIQAFERTEQLVDDRIGVIAAKVAERFKED